MKKFFQLLAVSGFMTLSVPALAQFSVQESFNASGYTYSFFSLASTETDQTEFEQDKNGTGRIATYNYLTVGTHVNYDLKGGLRLPFSYNTAGRDRFNNGEVQNQEIFLQDLILFLRNDSLALLPWDVSVYWEGSLYLPTGKFSRQQGTIGAYKNHFIFSKILSRSFDWEYDQTVKYTDQSRTAYKNTFIGDQGDEITVASLTKSWELKHRMNIWYKMDSETGVGLQAGLEDTYYNSSKENSKSLDRSVPLTKPTEHLVKLGPAARFALSNKINFILNFTDVVNARQNMKELGQFRSKNTEVALLSFVRF